MLNCTYCVLLELLYGCDDGDIVSQKLVSVAAVFTSRASSCCQLKLKSCSQQNYDKSDMGYAGLICVTLSNLMLVGS